MFDSNARGHPFNDRNIMNKVILIDDCGDGCPIIYEAETDEDVIVLSHSKYDATLREEYMGECVATLVDTGDSCIISFPDSEEVELDYGQVAELRMLLNYYNENSGMSDFVAVTNKFREI